MRSPILVPSAMKNGSWRHALWRTRSLQVVIVVWVLMVAGVAAILTIPSLKRTAKEKWHRWRCPEVPEQHSVKRSAPDGSTFWDDPGGRSPVNRPDPQFYFEDPSAPGFTTMDGRGALLIEHRSPAVTRRVGDVSRTLISISAGVLMKCEAPNPDVRIIIRIDLPDGTLLDWNEKKLRVDEHAPGQWEIFNHEWLLRGLKVPSDAMASVFLTTTEPLAIDRLSIVFRSDRPLERPS